MRLFVLGFAVACGQEPESDCVHSFYADADGDGHGVPEATVTGCIAPPGYETTHDDCNDRNRAVHPGAVEQCNGIDDDCDGHPDLPAALYVDLDRDGYGKDDASSCDQPDLPSAPVGGDCDDADAAVHPGVDEICNGIDDDCEGTADVDPIDGSISYTDADGDGYGDDATVSTSCELPAGSVTIGGDCDDDLSGVNPSRIEVCNEIDDDCDTLVDFDDPDLHATPQYADGDGDGFGDPSTTMNACTSMPGWVDDATDCDDSASAVNPHADEICNAIDDDCDDLTDDDDSSVTGRSVLYADDDGDGFGTLPSLLQCFATTGYTETHGDCDDSDAGVGLPTMKYRDADGDGYGGDADDRCPGPASTGWVATDGDCDDTRSDVLPGAAEVCDDADNNCDGLVDEDDPLVVWTTFYADTDEDGYGDDAVSVSESCDAPSGYVARRGDCGDGDAWVHPSAPEYCDEKDNDCDGSTDDSVVYVEWYADDDGDGYGDDTDVLYGCEIREGASFYGGDCDDAAATAYPGGTEICVNGVDDDCDGVTDPCPLDLDDADWSLVGPTVKTDVSTLGYAVLATDLNADGAADLVAAGPDIDPPVYVLLGPQSGESTLDAAAVTFESGSGSELGDAIDAADADLDGDADLLLGAPGDHTAYLLLGPLTASADATTADASFAVSDRGPSATVVKIVPDYDGDGKPEVAVNSFDETAGAREGQVFLAPATARRSVFRLRTDATYTYEGDANYQLGSSIVAIGDTTGDGIEELALGASGPAAQKVFLVAGGEAEGTYAISDAAIASLSADETGRFGASIDAADTDLDGYTDLIVGAPSPWAAVYAFRGPFHGERYATYAEARWEGETAMGFSVAADGDVDADGVPDVLIGGCVVETGWGVAYLDFGPATGVVDAADLILFGADREAVTGYSLGFVPDWTGDGGSEVVLGAPYFVGSSAEPGASHLYVFFSDNLH